MATNAIDRFFGAVRDLLLLLGPFPGRLQFSIRLAIICALTALVVELYQTPDPALTIYVAFFLIKPDRTTSMVLSLVLLVLITLIVGVLILLSIAVADEPLWRVATMALISFCLLFAASASKLKPIASIVALIAAYALDLLGTVHIGELATRALLYAWLFVGIPAGVSIAVNLVAGSAPRRLAEQVLAHRLRLCAAMLRDPDDLTRHRFRECLLEGPGEIPTWLKLAGLERTSPPEDIAALAQATNSTQAILSLVDLISRDPAISPADPRLQRAAQLFDEMAGIFQKGGYPTDIMSAEPVETGSAAAIATPILAELHTSLAEFAEPRPPEPAAKSAPEPAGGFFLPDAFNSEHVRYALKTTLAAMFCYVAYSLLDWPGIHTCLITCYIVSLGSTAETIEKLTLRIVGCLIGAGAGIAAIVFLMPNVTSIGGLMVIVFVAALASAWIAAGSPRIAYVGFQVAFAFFLSVVQGPAPAFDMTIARDRVIGILFGNLVVAVIFTLVWPVSVAERVDPAIAALLRRLAELAGAPDRQRRLALAAEAQAAAGAVEQDIGLIGYEPSSLRPAQRWLDSRRDAMQAIAALEAPLLLAANQGGLPGDAQGRLDRLANLLDAQGVSDENRVPAEAPFPQMTIAGGPAVGALVENLLARLEGLVRMAFNRQPEGMADRARG